VLFAIIESMNVEKKLLKKKSKRRKSFHLQAAVGILNSTEEATTQQPAEAPAVHRGGTCSDTFTFTLVTFNDPK
jgi:hypothetical protein